MGVTPRAARAAAAVAAFGLAGTLLSACESTPEDRDVVALLVSDAGSERYAQQDLPAFGAAMESACADCRQIVRDAGGDADRQRSQLDDVVAAGADVVVLNPVSAESGEELVAAARVPVVAYDRLVPGADRFVGVDEVESASGTADALRGMLPRGRSPVLVVSDGPGGLTARVVRQLGPRVRVRATLPPDQASTARAWTAQQLRSGGPVAAVVTASDETAGEIAAGVADAGVPVNARPLVTGHDGTLEGVRRLVTGTQDVTVHASRADEATAAAEIAARLAQGRRAPAAKDEVEGVPATLVPPTPVTLPTLTDTLVREGVYTTEQICEGATQARCTSLGIR